MNAQLSVHERVKCVVPGNAINSEETVSLNEIGVITRIAEDGTWGAVRFDLRSHDLLIPISHLRTEDYQEGKATE